MDDFNFRGIRPEPIQFKSNTITSIPLRDIRDNLVLDLDFVVRNGNDTKDQSGNGVDLTLSGPIKARGMGNGNALYWDGIDDYGIEKSYATEQGIVSINVTNGSAALTDDGQDFTPYVGDGVDNKYMVIVKDEESEVAYGYCGALNGGVTSIKLYSSKTGSTQNLTGKDASFDTGDTLTYVIRKSALQVTTGDFAIIMLIKTDVPPGTYMLIRKGAGGLEHGLISYDFYVLIGKVALTIDDDVTAKFELSSSTINDGAWHVIIANFDRSGLMSIYIDGALNGSPPDISGVATLENSNFFELGSSNLTNNNFDGDIGLVRFYHRAFTAAEIRDMYYYLLNKVGMINNISRGL